RHPARDRAEVHAAVAVAASRTRVPDAPKARAGPQCVKLYACLLSPWIPGLAALARDTPCRPGGPPLRSPASPAGPRAPMAIRDGVTEAIGDTPLIRLRRASEATGCTILGKAEFMNPGQSVKDRPAKQMILEAEQRGDLK